MREIDTLRTECSKTYDLGDGKRKLVCYTKCVHYLDEYGLWKELDDPVLADDGDGTTFYNVFGKDGYVRYVGGDWATARSAGSGTSLGGAVSENWAMAARGASNALIERSFFYFDTSAIHDDAVIDVVQFQLYGHGAADSSVDVREGTQADGGLTLGDYDAFTGLRFGWTSWAVGAYNTITFNALGRSKIDKTGVTKLCCREYAHDAINIDPGNTLYANGCRYSDYSGTDYDPKLVVYYTAPTAYTIDTTESMPILPDTVVFDLSLNILDSLSFTDLHGVDVVQAIQDSLVESDQVSGFVIGQSISDMLQEADEAAFSVEELRLSDVLSEFDQPVFLVEQPVSDMLQVGIVQAQWQDTEGVIFQNGEAVWAELETDVVFDVSKFVPDILPESDGVTFDIGEVIPESLSIADIVPFVVVPSQIYDAHAISDVPVLGTGQPIPESLTISDEPIIQNAPQISDSLPLSDSYRVAMGMALQDALSAGDALGKALISPVAGTVDLWEQLSFWDRVRFVVTNVYQEVLSLVGSVAKWVTKPVSESFQMADSFPGRAIYRNVSKGIWDYLYLFDAVVFDIETAMQDSLGWLDEILFLPGKNFAEILTLGDSVLYSELLELLDVLQIVDDYDRICDTYRDYTELLPITDEVVYGAATTILDLLNFSDTPLLLVGKVISDVLPISDVVGPLPILQSILDVLALSDFPELHRYLPGEIPQIQWVLSRLANLKPGSSWVRSVDPYELYVAVGESDITGTVFDTVLWDEVHRKKGVIRVVANTVFVRAVFGQDEPTADGLSIKEIAIFDAAAGGTLIERWILGSPVAKDNIDEVVVECAITIVHGEIEALTSGPADALAMADTIDMVLTPGP